MDVTRASWPGKAPHQRLLEALLAILVLLSGLTACKEDTPAPKDEPPPFRADGVLEFVRPNGSRITAIAIEIAEGDSARQRGLMRRRSLPDRGGMLFLADSAYTQRFWMKNTYMPLDIIFVGPDSSVVNIAERTRPLSEQTITSEGPAQYVVEVRGGFTERHGITNSTRIRWARREEL